MLLLLKYWRYLLVVALCVGCFAWGRLGVPTPVATDKISEVQDTEKDKHETVEHKNDKVTTITKKADGSVVTTVVDHSQTSETKDESVNKVEKTNETKKTPVVAAQDPYRPSYRLGVQAHNELALTWQPSYSVEAGYRVLGNLWGTASYDIQDHKAGLGLSIDF